jgi:hypothetical protein
VESVMKLAKPQYGCLKGGKLPTYRSWMNQTQKVPPPNLQQNTSLGGRLTKEQNRAEMRQFFQKRKDEKRNVLAKRPLIQRQKQKRILRRTFRIGKSKVYPKVGVLVSNRTIRNQTQSLEQSLKETPIEEVRKYLVKTGFIRVGSSSPNDVLRKMYESAKMMCGEINNHNADNLLYNYLNNGIDV